MKPLNPHSPSPRLRTIAFVVAVCLLVLAVCVVPIYGKWPKKVCVKVMQPHSSYRYVIVKEFGAIPGDNVDDAEAFTEALQFALDSNCIIVVPKGNYLMYGHKTKDIKIYVNHKF